MDATSHLPENCPPPAYDARADDAFAVYGITGNGLPPDDVPDFGPQVAAFTVADLATFGLLTLVGYTSPDALARRLALPLADVAASLARLETAGLVSRYVEDWPF